MKLIYRPSEDEPIQEFVFVPQKLMSPEAEAIERVGKSMWDSFEEFSILFMKGNMRARRAVLWVMLKRKTPTLKFDDVQINSEMLTIDWDDREQRAIRDAIAADPDMDSEEKEVYLRQIDSVIFSEGDEPLKEASENSSPDDSTSVDTDSPQDSENLTPGT